MRSWERYCICSLLGPHLNLAWSSPPRHCLQQPIINIHTNYRKCWIIWFVNDARTFCLPFISTLPIWVGFSIYRSIVNCAWLLLYFNSLSGSLNFFLISQGSSASVHFVSERLLIQACENAQSCLQRDNVAGSKTGEIFEYMQMLKKIRSLKDFALTKAGSRSGMCIMCQLPKIHVTFHMQIWLRYVMNFSFSILS